MLAACRRFLELSTADRTLALESAALLVFVRGGLSILSFDRVRRLLEQHSAFRPLIGTDVRRLTPMRIASIASGVARRLPGRSTCLVDALVVHALLRRRGYEPELCLGVRRHADDVGPDSTLTMDAHAWVECDGRVVVGAIDDLNDYAVLSAQRTS
jgi:hypothetical protein